MTPHDAGKMEQYKDQVFYNYAYSRNIVFS